ncbi:MAG: Fic family protein [Armatimonadetes bacterium]|nr:Fic family protein [Armatimonadota bacterium]
MQTFTKQYVPEPSLRGHFEFMLKHEAVSFEFLARLFDRIAPEDLLQWVTSEPTGQYSRRTCFLYEWFTGKQLACNGSASGGYHDVLDSKRYLAASDPVVNRRWRLRDNMPGSRDFCPLVVLTDSVPSTLDFDVRQAWNSLEADFGEELLRRSAVWLTTKESKASFAIEGETKQLARIRRFASVMESELGRHTEVLSEETLAFLQREILGDRSVGYGIRKSPIFVGQTLREREIIHYIGPHWDALSSMLEGLAKHERKTRGRSAIIRAATASFGFVYIHPLTDGNGRVSRFLVNDILRKDGAIPEPFLLPISAVIARAMREYDRILELISRPLMRRYEGQYRLGKRKRFDDGLSSDLEFECYEDAAYVWRFPDLTEHVAYMASVIRETIEVELRAEAVMIRSMWRARSAVNEIIEGPDETLDRIIRSVRENGWLVSGKLAEEIPLLQDAETADSVIRAVRRAFASDVPQ